MSKTKYNKAQLARIMIAMDKHIYLALKEVVLHEIRNTGKHISMKQYIDMILLRHIKNKERKEGLVVLYKRRER